MQTVLTMAERLDMSAEEAVEKLKYMLFNVKGIESDISDEQCDLLIDIDDDPALADEVREKKLAEIEKVEAAAAKKKATVDKKKAAAKKKVTAKKKAPAKKKAAKKKATKKKAVTADGDGEAIEKVLAKKPIKKARIAEILPSEEEMAAKEARADDTPEIVVGTAIDHDSETAEVIRADGTHVAVDDRELDDLGAKDIKKDIKDDSGEESPLGLLAQAELQEKEDNRRKATQRPVNMPDPRVVEEVIRKDNLKKTQGRPRKSEKEVHASYSEQELEKSERVQPAGRGANRRTGKTARKRQRKVEKMRAEETLRRSAAAAIREYQSGAMDTGPKKRRKKRVQDGESGESEVQESLVIDVEETMTVDGLATAMETDPTDLILELMERGVMATKNQVLSIDLIRDLAEPQGYEVRSVIPEEEDVMKEEPDAPEDLLPRAPVITVMGHVDHGKTSLLDHVRKASVAAGESGGITQHIAAYDVSLSQGRVVFLDTPGHEAFTAMRARGAQITDVVVLVVAADDGIMPQTKEAIDHARAAEVPIVVAINKCDKANAEPDRIRQELVQYELTDEQWGGSTIVKNISATTGEGIDELMDLLVLETELLELKANPSKPARGTVIESEVTRGQGPVAWVLVQSGTLRVGDIFIAGETYGKVRSMQNARGEAVTEAGPSTPVAVTGFTSVADAGDLFVTTQDERTARSIAEKRAHRSKLKAGPSARHVTLEDFHERLLAGEKQELNVLVKADVQGSIDVLESTLPKLGNEEVQVRIVHSGVGSINESDVLLASASDAVILGFQVETMVKARRLAQSDGVDIRDYQVIYEMTEDVRKSLEGLLTPDKVEVVIGHAEIRQVFKSSALGNIAGCTQIDGETKRDSLARLLRNNEVIYEGRIGSLRREKDQVNAVQTGFECGIKLADFTDIQVGDLIEVYRVEEVAKTLA